MRIIILGLSLAMAAFGCRGGGEGIDDLVGAAGGMGGDMGGDMGGAGGGGPCDVEPPGPLACPTPASLPFDLEVTGWSSQTNEDVAFEGNPYAYENQDLYGTPDRTQAFIGRQARGAALGPRGIADEAVDLWAFSQDGAWLRIGQDRTDENGYYRFTLDPAQQFGVGDHTIYAGFGADGSCAPHGIFLWPRGTQVVISDIDGTLTLSDAELTRQIGDPSYVPEINTASPELMQAWAAKGYKTMYLTARPHTFRLQTRAWLDLKGMPYGPVITANSLVFQEAARAYKEAAVRQLSEEYGWQVVAAYGNATSDIDAYEDAGHPKDVTFIIGENAGQSGTVAIPDQDYTQHIANYVQSQPDAQQPPTLVQAPYCP